MNYVYKHFKMIWSFIKINWRNSIEYMGDFTVIILNFIVVTALTVIFWKSILGDVAEVSNWSMNELIILGIFGSVSWALSEFFAGSWQLPEKILQGELDKYLSKPINPLYALVMESMQLDEVLKGVILFIVLIPLYFWKYDYSGTIFNVIMSIFCLIIGVLIISFIRIFFSLLSFWIGDSNILNRIVHLEDFNLERYPINIYQRNIQSILTWFIPVGFMATYPAMIFLNKQINIPKIFIIEFFVLFIWFVIILIEWKLGVKKYESNGG